MPEFSPLAKLMNRSLAGATAEAIEDRAAKVQELPPVRILTQLQTPDMKSDPNELIKHRFLYRGAVCLLVGPTGIGKSALLMQLSLHLAVGRDLFGIMPGDCYRQRGLRVLLIQAENDEGDLAEMRDGVLKGCSLTAEEKVRAQQGVFVCTLNDRTADRFAETVEALLIEHGPFDVLIIDPAFAYLGGDSNSQKDVSRFMRNLLNPLLQRHRIGLILAHHTNKPLRGKEKDNWEAGDFAYLGAGSAEWINPARAALAIRSLGSETVFELRAPKRGKRLGWTDDDGQPTTVQYIAHHREPGIICWRKADAEEVEALLQAKKPGRPPSCSAFEILHCIQAQEGRNQSHYMRVAAAVLGCHESSAQRAIQTATDKGWIRYIPKNQENLYSLTEKGRAEAQKHPSAVQWADSKLETPQE